MKCIEAEKSILLQDSGELSAGKAFELKDHLDGCASCRQFMEIMLDSTHEFDAEFEPSAKIVQDVLRTARKQAPTRKVIPLFSMKPALAAAASFVFILGVMVTNFNSNRVGMELMVNDAQLMEPEDQVVSVMYDGLSEDDLAFHFLMTYDGESEG